MNSLLDELCSDAQRAVVVVKPYILVQAKDRVRHLAPKPISSMFLSTWSPPSKSLFEPKFFEDRQIGSYAADIRGMTHKTPWPLLLG